MSIQDGVNEMKSLMESAIISGGITGKESLIRSKKLINILHEAVKFELVDNGLKPGNLYPPLNDSKPELKIAGFLKKKDQDICVVPSSVTKKSRKITWGPLQAENETDPLGHDYAEQTLVVNVRSQMSSLAKNADTLFERTFAEALNLHSIYPEMVLGEVYLIPVYEYDDSAMKDRLIRFKKGHTNIEKYVSFFSSLSGRTSPDKDNHMYERCTLVVVDFSKKPCHIYNSTAALKADSLVSSNFNVELSRISFDGFASDLISQYAKRFNIDNIRK